MLTLGVHASGTWCVCVSVSVSAAILALQAMEGGLLATPTALELRQPEKYNGNFPEIVAFERYAVKKATKPICIVTLAYLHFIRLLCVLLKHKKSQ